MLKLFITNVTTRLEGGRLPSGVFARLTGTLEQLGVADIVQMLQMSHKSATIAVQCGSRVSTIWCSHGAVVDAEHGRLRGEAAFYRIVGIQQGWMVTELRHVSRARTIDAPLQRLLLEAARRKDEGGVTLHRLGGGQRRYRACHQRAPQALGRAQLNLWRSFVQPRALSDAIEASELGDLEALRLVEAWVRSRRLIDAGTASTPQPPSRVGESSVSVPTVRPLIQTLGGAQPSEPARLSGARKVALGALALASLAGAIRWAASGSAGLPVNGGHGFAASEAVRQVSPPVLSRPRPSRPAEPAPMEPTPVEAALPLIDLGERAAASQLAAAAAQVPADSSLSPGEGLAQRGLQGGVPSFEVKLAVKPANAEIWLDGERAPEAGIRALLPRDGSVHEVRVTASGHVPTRILFRDAPPPAELQLEPLSRAKWRRRKTVARGGRRRARARSASARQSDASASRKRPGHEVRRSASRAGPSAAPQAKNEPRVQIIGGDEPNVERVD